MKSKWNKLLGSMLIVLGASGLATGQEKSNAEQSAIVEQSVKEGINNDFKAPDLSVEEYLNRFEVESREVYAKRNEILELVNLLDGQKVIDLGAGTGFYTFLFADKVGTKGKVLALDIAPAFIASIKDKADSKKVPQVDAALSSDVDFEAEPNAYDVVFLCDVYHHLEYPRRINQRIYESLKAGGKLVVIDFKREEGVSRDWVLNHVRAGESIVRQEIESSGLVFESVNRDLLQENYILVFSKP